MFTGQKPGPTILIQCQRLQYSRNDSTDLLFRYEGADISGVETGVTLVAVRTARLRSFSA
jgi:hypothetical protein